MRKDFLKYGNIISFIAVIVVNILATMGILGGVTTKDVSYMYRSALTPADYAFSIWSLIYILLGITVYLQFKNEQTRDSLGSAFFLSNLLNLAWIFTWQYRKITLSFAAIFILMIVLLVLMRSVKAIGILPKMSIGLYTGWINVAMLANLGALSTANNWNPGTVGAIICLVFGLLWIVCFLFAYSNIYYAIGACWGYLGIAMASEIKGIRTLAIVCSVIFVICMILTTKNKKEIDVMTNY